MKNKADSNHAVSFSPPEDFLFPPGTVAVWNGSEWVPLPPSDTAKTPITASAHATLKRVRINITKQLGFRPDFMIVASAMIEAAEHLSGIAEIVRQYGEQVYQRRPD